MNTNAGAAMTGLREMISDMEFVRDNSTDPDIVEFAQESLDVADCYLQQSGSNDDTIIFPDFWMTRSESGWRWVSKDATQSSQAAFEFAHVCALNAQHAINKKKGSV